MDLKSIPQKWFLIFLVLIAVLGTAVGNYFYPEHLKVADNKVEAETNREKPAISEEKLDKLIDSMSTEEKVGQLFLMGFDGETLSKEWLDFVNDRHIGGIFFNSLGLTSLEKVRDLTSNKQDERGVPYLYAVSQENGGQEAFNEGVTMFPSNMALAAAKDPKLAYEVGHITGQELRALGINLNLGPVLDVLSGKESSIIGSRAFSDDPQLVTLMGMRYLAGLQNSGVAGAVKYFPGMGDATLNSEYTVPMLNDKKSDLNTEELVPFKEAVKQKTSAIIVGHGLFMQIDPHYPASMSDKIITGLLRHEMGYQGVVITDDMSKRAVADDPGTPPAAVKAIKAGADIIFIRTGFASQRDAYKAVFKAVKRGDITPEQLKRSLKRILRMKYKYMLNDKNKQQLLWEKLGSTPSRQKAREIASESVTLVKTDEKILPLKKDSRILVLTPDELPSDHKPFFLAELLEKDYHHIAYKQFVNYENDEEKRSIKNLATENETIIVMTYNAGPNQAKLLADLLAMKDKKIIVISVGNPYDINLFPNVPVYLATYSACPSSIEVLADILSGKAKAKGALPVAMEKQKSAD